MILNNWYIYVCVCVCVCVTSLVFNINTSEVPFNHLLTNQARTSPSCLSLTKHEVSKVANQAYGV